MMYVNHHHQQQVNQQHLRLQKTRKTVSFNGRSLSDHHQKNSNNEQIGDQIHRLQTVDLSGLSLDSLPSPSLNLGVISKLDLSNNNLQIIPESLIARLLNVSVLDVHSNQLRSLPNSIGCLSKLKILNISGNLIESIPRTIENCRSLEELNANFNKLQKLPETMGFELHKLRKLSANSNKLTCLPHSLSHLTSLRVLDARLNCLQSLPEDLENMVNLEVLNVSQNFHHLRALPYSLGLLLSLVELDVSYNALSALPDSLGCLGSLKRLSVEGNPLVSPPPEVILRGLPAIRDYLADRINNPNPNKKNKSKNWLGRLVKYKTFASKSNSSPVLTSSFPGSPGQYRPSSKLVDHDHDPLGSPNRFMAMLSPLRIFSPRRSHQLGR